MGILIGLGIFCGLLLLCLAILLWAPIKYIGKAELRTGSTGDERSMEQEIARLTPSSEAKAACGEENFKLLQTKGKGLFQFELQISSWLSLVRLILHHAGSELEPRLSILGIEKKVPFRNTPTSHVSTRWPEKVKSFWHTPDKRELNSMTWQMIGQIARQLKPQRCTGWMEYGFSDPSVTGYVFGLWCMGNTFLKTELEVWPNFQTETLQGRFEVAGEFRLYRLLISFWRYTRIPAVRRILQLIGG